MGRGRGGGVADRLVVLDFRAQKRALGDLERAGDAPSARSRQHERADRTESAAPMRLTMLVPSWLFLASAFLCAPYERWRPVGLPSALIGPSGTQTDLPPVEGLTRDGQPVPGLSSRISRRGDRAERLGVGGASGRDEAPLLMRIAQDKRIRVVGMNQKDRPENARRFLGRYGNPTWLGPISAAAPRSNGASTACRRPSSRPRRQDRLQAGRTDHAAKPGNRSSSRDREALAATR